MLWVVSCIKNRKKICFQKYNIYIVSSDVANLFASTDMFHELIFNHDSLEEIHIIVAKGLNQAKFLKHYL